MRKILVITLVGAILLAAIPGAALAGDRHSSNDLAAGLFLGATAAVVGGVLLNAFAAPAIVPPVAYAPPPAVYAPAPPVMYAPPPVVYAPAPPVVYGAPPVIYRPAPVIVRRHWAPTRQWEHERYERGRGWDRH